MARRETHTSDAFGDAYAIEARKVLKGIRVNLAMMRESQAFDRWHAAWRAAIVQFCMVGHVLHKVDGSRTIYLVAACSVAFHQWRRDDASSCGFSWIDRERSLILKEKKDSVRFVEPPNLKDYRLQEVELLGQLWKADELISVMYNWWVSEIELIEISARDAKRRATAQKRRALTPR